MSRTPKKEREPGAAAYNSSEGALKKKLEKTTQNKEENLFGTYWLKILETCSSVEVGRICLNQHTLASQFLEEIISTASPSPKKTRERCYNGKS
jgi:hypothetical protein